jgi:hypothetical protein
MTKLRKTTGKQRKEAPKAHPGITVQGQPALSPQGPPGMEPDEIEYRTMLQEAILWVSKQVLDEQRKDIIARAEVRVRTLMELRA